MAFDLNELPIISVLPQLLEAFRSRPSVVLKAPPGAGKTTVVPWELTRIVEGRVLLTQPRRLAARSVAARISQINSFELGQEVGYQVRLDRKWGDASRLIAMTTGVLLRRLIHDPFLDGTSVVVLDEFHERPLELDLVLGMLVRLQQTVRPDLKLLVMSATIDCGPVASLLGDAPSIESPGRTFEVQVRYSKNYVDRPIEESVSDVLPTALSSTTGHVIIFLPGVGEIIRTERVIGRLADKSDFSVMPLFGEMDSREQDNVLQPSERRKIILATNVAETSLTIDGVTCVIDSGQVRVMRFDPSVGMPRLCLESNSQASADQRAGRAGRQSPGVAFRLWPEKMQRTRAAFDTPEILRGDLAGALLQLAGMGEDDFESFPWLTQPSAISVAGATSMLTAIGAFARRNERIKLTNLGRQMLALPAHPRIARLLLAGRSRGVVERGALAAAILSERDPFRVSRAHVKRGVGKPNDTRTERTQSDLVDRVARLEHVLNGGDDPLVNRGAVHQVVQAANQFLSVLKSNDKSKDLTSSVEPASGLPQDVDLALRRAIFEAYPDRLAKARQRGADRALMVGGNGVRIGRDSNVTDAELYVCIDVEQRDRDAEVRMASAVDNEWLDEDQLTTQDELFFHPTQRNVQARRRRYWLDLMISETPIAVGDTESVAELLFEQVNANWDQAFPADDPKVGAWLARVERLREWQPEGQWPDIDESMLKQIGRQLCHGRRSLAEVKAAPWSDFLQTLLSYEQNKKLDSLVPTEWAAPSGNRVTIQYERGQPPKISVRLQELFGLPTTPTIVAGRVSLLLELLGPNYRPQQLTSDLTSFWKNTYPVIRKELARRYPKHHWPDDPQATAATRSGLKRDAR